MARSIPVGLTIVGGETWRTDAKYIYAYLRRDMSDARNQRIKVYPDTGAGHIQRTVPLIYRLARELSTLYLRKPGRRLKGATADQSKVYLDHLKRAQMNRRLRSAQEHLSVLQSATVWVWLTETGYTLKVIPIHQQWVVMRSIEGQDVEDVAEWYLRIPVPVEGTIHYATARITSTSAWWIDGPSKQWKNAPMWAADGSNPFGRIPVALLRGADPGDGTVFPPVPQDLLDAQRAVNHDFTDIGEVRRKQGFGQAWMAGVSPSDAKKIQVGPERTVGLKDKDAKFAFASPQPDLEGSTQSLRAFLEMVIATNGMNPATVMKSAGITALAKIIEILDREVERIRAVDEFEAAEQTLYELIALALKAHNGGREVLPVEGVEVEVHYREPITPADPTSDAQAKAQRKQMNLDSSASILSDEKAIDIEDAQEIVKRNRKLDAELAVASSAPTDAPADKPDQDGDKAAKQNPLDAAQPSTDVQKEAMNGAQTDSMRTIVTDATAGLISARSARAMLRAAFPSTDTAIIDEMLADVGSFVPKSKEPAKAPVTVEAA